MNQEVLKITRRTLSRGACVLDSISKIVKENGSNIAFSLTRNSFLATILFPLDKTVSYTVSGVNELVDIHYTTSGDSVKLLLNETHDLFTLLSANTCEFLYTYPENVTELSIIDSDDSCSFF